MTSIAFLSSVNKFVMLLLFILFSSAPTCIVCSVIRGTQQKILRKRLKNNKKARIKISEAILSILGDCWEKFICSSLPARLMKRFPASKVHLQPATWLTWKFPSRRRPWGKIHPFEGGAGRGLIGNWVWPKGYIHPFSGGRGGEG